MANRISIRHGQQQPTNIVDSLLAYELGYCDSNNTLYIGLPNPNNSQIIPTPIISQNNAISGDMITSGIIQTKDKKTFILNITSNSVSISNGTIANSTIKNGTISDTSISNGTITNSTIKNASISNGTISGASISNGTISNPVIINGSIKNVKINDTDFSNGQIKVTNSIIIDSYTIPSNLTIPEAENRLGVGVYTSTLYDKELPLLRDGPDPMPVIGSEIYDLNQNGIIDEDDIDTISSVLENNNNNYINNYLIINKLGLTSYEHKRRSSSAAGEYNIYTPGLLVRGSSVIANDLLLPYLKISDWRDDYTPSNGRAPTEWNIGSISDPMNSEDIGQNCISLRDNLFKVITSNGHFDNETTWQYTNASVVIPAGCYAILDGYVGYNYSNPVDICIQTSNPYQSWNNVTQSNYNPSESQNKHCIGIVGPYSQDLTYYLHAKMSNNNHTAPSYGGIIAFYFKVPERREVPRG